MKYDWSDLENLYVTQGLSGYQIAKIKGCIPSTIYRVLRKRNIRVRALSEAAILGFKKERRINPNLFKKGEKSHFWKGGRTKTKKGYILIFMPEHPNSDKRGYIPEHRLVMSQMLGRPLLKSEVVHHRPDVAKDDNREEVLYLMPNPSEHNKLSPCSNCELKKEIRLLRWELKEMREALQLKLGRI